MADKEGGPSRPVGGCGELGGGGGGLSVLFFPSTRHLRGDFGLQRGLVKIRGESLKEIARPNQKQRGRGSEP